MLLLLDAFNIFNTQTILDYNNFVQLDGLVPNPDFGLAGMPGVVAGQQFTAPRQIRVGARIEFSEVESEKVKVKSERVKVKRPFTFYLLPFNFSWL